MPKKERILRKKARSERIPLIKLRALYTATLQYHSEAVLTLKAQIKAIDEELEEKKNGKQGDC